MKQTEAKITRLQDLTGITEPQAREALAAAGGDLLEALLWLERSGVIEHSGVKGWSTTGGTAPEPEPEQAKEAPQPQSKRLSDWVRMLYYFLVNNRLEAYKKYDPTRQIQCPIGALLGLLVIAWYVVAVILIAGICLGWRYRLAGPQLGKRNINNVVSWIDDLAEQARDELKHQVNRHK